MKILVYKEIDHYNTPEGKIEEHIEHRCSNCKSHLYMNQKFCDGCGNELDWSKINSNIKVLEGPSESYNKHRSVIERFMRGKEVPHEEICESIYQITGIKVIENE